MEKKELKNKKEDMRGEALVIQWYQMPSTWPLFIGPKSFMKFKENYDGVYGIRNSLHVIHCGVTKVTNVTKLMAFRRRKNPRKNLNGHSPYYIFFITGLKFLKLMWGVFWKFHVMLTRWNVFFNVSKFAKVILYLGAKGV